MAAVRDAAIADHLRARDTRTDSELLMQVRGVRLGDPGMEQVQDLPLQADTPLPAEPLGGTREMRGRSIGRTPVAEQIRTGSNKLPLSLCG
jgi:hypothetical protein